ncbi:hypothetical protein CASFOL_021262 [Castilleja foliolosa]|uniref:Coenzyme Q-binding protein COQ10 START domain-containing protein n=1 Tax=Castilleja foliolosa TaxID=1961234 RepID=A0ABD3CW22_9LAMI
MSPFKPASKGLGRLINCRNLFRQQITYNSNHNQIRCLSSISGTITFFSLDKRRCKNDIISDPGNFAVANVFQKRAFLGCSDGGEGYTLAKVHEERRVVLYSPEQMFNVVAAVDMYQEFLPWCQRSEIIRHNPNGTFDAELEIGFKFLVESYTSHVELSKHKSIKTTSSQSSLFDHLINVWEFNPGPVPGTCSLYFLVDFKFKSPFYRQKTNNQNRLNGDAVDRSK